MNNPRTSHLAIIFASSLMLTACGGSSEQNNSPQGNSQFKKISYKKNETRSTSNTQQSSSKQLSNQPLSIKWRTGEKRLPDDVRLSDPSTSMSYVDGKMIKNDDIPLIEYLAENGKIEFRKGKDFFPEWSIDIVAGNLKPDSTIRLKNQTATFQNKPVGEKLPKTSFLRNTNGVIKTGKLSNLGMPIQVNVKAGNAKEGVYHILGKVFATIGDIRVKNGKLDATHDSFRTMDLIARGFLKGKDTLPSLSLKHSQYSSDRNSKGVNEGVEGLLVYSEKNAQGKPKLTRVHMLKKTEGWTAERILSPAELVYSHKKSSKRERDQIKVATYKKIESFLKTNKLNNHIDSSVTCSTTKDLGLCSVNITVLENNEKTCTRKAYQFKKVKKWEFSKEVSPDLKIDYKTKKLVKDKRKAKNLKEYLLNKSIGLMFGKCSMF